VGELKAAHAAANRSRKRTFFVAELFGLDQVAGQSRTIQLDQLFIVPATGRVDGAGKQLLACSDLPGDENGSVRLVAVSGEMNSATNAYCASTKRGRLRTNAWKCSSPLLCEAGSTIALRAVISSYSSRVTPSETFGVERFSDAILGSIVNLDHSHLLMMKASISQGIARDG
jgi:hypothetical protein